MFGPRGTVVQGCYFHYTQEGQQLNTSTYQYFYCGAKLNFKEILTCLLKIYDELSYYLKIKVIIHKMKKCRNVEDMLNFKIILLFGYILSLN